MKKSNQHLTFGTLKFIPLGGNGQVTKNMFLYETKKDILIVDCGMGFPPETMFGIDMVIPDISYLKDKRHKIRGILITHGHEDHIGALPFIIPQLNVPIYATKLTCGLINVRLKERNVTKFRLINIEPKQRIPLGGFEAQPFHVTHSIPDSVGYVIRTSAGTFVHTGDFKFDWTPVDGKKPDTDTLAKVGQEGILALMTDSLRSEKPGSTLSETVVGESFREVMKKSSGRVLITTFSSNISRMKQAMEASQETGRKVAIVGRSMENNCAVAQKLGFLIFPPGLVIPVEEINELPDNNQTLIIAGSQGQAGSALTRIAEGDHKLVFIKSGDEIIFSADPIPGNQDAVYWLIDKLTSLGARVHYSDITSDFHVSGHGAADELLLMISLTKPKYLVPISGMYRQMKQLSFLASEKGMDKSSIFVIEEGAILEFSNGSAKVSGNIPTNNIFVDGLGVGDVGNVVLRDRQLLAEEGIVVVIVTWDKGKKLIIGDPDIVSRGFVYMKEAGGLISETKNEVKRIFKGLKTPEQHILREKIVDRLEKFLYKKTQRRPMVLPVVVEI